MRTIERRAALQYTPDGEDPPQEFGDLLRGIDTSAVKAVRVSAYTQNWAGQNVQASKVTARLLRIQAKLVDSKISSSIVKVSIDASNDPNQIDRIEVIAEVLTPRTR